MSFMPLKVGIIVHFPKGTRKISPFRLFQYHDVDKSRKPWHKITTPKSVQSRA